MSVLVSPPAARAAAVRHVRTDPPRERHVSTPEVDTASLRELVFAAIVKERDRRPKFAAVMDRLGFFTAVDFIDGIVDVIIAAGVPRREADRG